MNEEPKPKTITIKADKDFAAENLAVNSTNPDFTTEVKKGKAAGEWSIVVTPKKTDKAMAGAITIKPDFPKDAPKIFYANAQIMAANTATQPVPAPNVSR